MKNHLGPAFQSNACRFRIPRQASSFDLYDAFSFGFQPLEMSSLMSIALLLQQGGIISTFALCWPFPTQVQQVQRDRMCAAHKPHEIGCRKKKPFVKFPHGLQQSPMSATL
ncbi:MAG: hypothetical protein ABJH93_05715 [Roseibium sp.]|uniref:hypothetical protein n=1 Tax=Roseibium sp. TaxID=1936156 RepID=UPI003296DB9D